MVENVRDIRAEYMRNTCRIRAEYMRSRPFNGLPEEWRSSRRLIPNYPPLEELLPPVVWKDKKHEATLGARRLQQ